MENKNCQTKDFNCEIKYKTHMVSEGQEGRALRGDKNVRPHAAERDLCP
jgi:hypothetical protein